MAPPSLPEESPAGPSYLVLRELDALTRRMEAVDRRIDHLDEHGTRGVDALRAAFTTLQRDLADHEALHAEQARTQIASRRWLIGLVVGLITPLYPLLITLLVGR
jgi:DNA invertase Pin-like site-specific DNA recombinase